MIHTLEVDGVILEFGANRVLQDVYIKCETAKITGLLGRNGTGKTCLMNIAHGMLKPTNHSVRLDGKALLDASRLPHDMMYLTQLNFIPGFLTLKRIFIDFKLDFSGFIQDFPEFEKYYNSKLKRLSGGERRIIEIYVIIASETRFCMLDEPFSHVMPVHVDVIKKLIVREKAHKGILITDHLYEHIIDICDELYVIKDGKTYLTKGNEDLETLGYINILNE
jgi:ABC-type lipopolysaccharide export system ATPase subunit